jgi:hypothetical protein
MVFSVTNRTFNNYTTFIKLLLRKLKGMAALDTALLVLPYPGLHHNNGECLLLSVAPLEGWRGSYRVHPHDQRVMRHFSRFSETSVDFELSLCVHSHVLTCTAGGESCGKYIQDVKKSSINFLILIILDPHVIESNYK